MADGMQTRYRAHEESLNNLTQELREHADRLTSLEHLPQKCDEMQQSISELRSEIRQVLSRFDRQDSEIRQVLSRFDRQTSPSPNFPLLPTPIPSVPEKTKEFHELQTAVPPLHRLERNTKRSVASSHSVISSTSPPITPIDSYRHPCQPEISSTVCSVPPVPHIIVPASPSSSTSSPYSLSTFANSQATLDFQFEEPPITLKPMLPPPHSFSSPSQIMPASLTKSFTQNCPKVATILESENVSGGCLQTATDPSKASVPVPDPTLHGLNDSDLTALVVDHTSDAVSPNKGKTPLLSADAFVQPDAKLGNKKSEASVPFRGNADQQTERSAVYDFLYPSKELLPDDKEMSIFDHLEELRQRAFVSIVAAGAMNLGCFAFSKELQQLQHDVKHPRVKLQARDWDYHAAHLLEAFPEGVHLETATLFDDTSWKILVGWAEAPDGAIRRYNQPTNLPTTFQLTIALLIWCSYTYQPPDLMDITFSLPALSATVVIHSTRLLFGGLCILNPAIILFISGKTDLLTWECPLDLKEAISSVCFASPRCADLPELLQVQMLFAAKYGREFVAAATELMPESGVNRQLIELLSVRAPPAEKKLQLLKEIAEARGLDWDPAASETELFKPHEDLLNGPRQFVGGFQVPLPKEKHDEVVHSAIVEGPVEESDSDVGLDPLEFPEVPKVLLRPSADAKSAPEIGACLPSAPHPEVVHESITYSGNNENSPCQPSIGPEDMAHEHDGKRESLRTQVSAEENKQSVPFITPPSLASASFSTRDRSPSPSLSMTRSEASVDLQDVWAAAQAAAESAEPAAAARSAASLAEFAVSFDLRAVLDTVLSFSGKSHEKGIELAVYVSRQVPEIAIGDPGRFHQIITNLVGNSIKFTKDKGHIFVSVYQADEISNPPYMMDVVLRHCLNSSQTYPNALSGFLAVDRWKSWENYTQETHTRFLRMHQNFSSYNPEDKFVLNKWSIDKCRRQWDPGKYYVALDPDALEFYLCV